MKPVCSDTSFLFSLYGADVHTSRAFASVRKLGRPLSLSVFNEYEFENATRFRAWRGLCSLEQAQASLEAFEADRHAGRLLIPPCNLARVVEEARRLSAVHTAKEGYRSFDILHVAAALCLGAGIFFSFDVAQRRLARAEGLKLNSFSARQKT